MLAAAISAFNSVVAVLTAVVANVLAAAISAFNSVVAVVSAFVANVVAVLTFVLMRLGILPIALKSATPWTKSGIFLSCVEISPTARKSATPWTKSGNLFNPFVISSAAALRLRPAESQCACSAL